MKPFPTILVAALALSFPASAGPAEESVGNDLVMMVHATLEPRGVLPGPPVGEAFLATNDGGNVVFHAITYGVDSGRPVVLRDAVLEITAVDGTTFTAAANGAPHGRAVCVEETNLPGHEGPIGACQVFVIAASEFEGRNVVTLTLRAKTLGLVPVVETYNMFAHAFLHMSMEGGPMTRAEADGHSDPTFFVVEHLVDPVA